jgi:hypothetical protein
MNITLKINDKWLRIVDSDEVESSWLKYGDLGFAVDTPMNLGDILALMDKPPKSYDYALPQSFFDRYEKEHGRRPFGVWSYDTDNLFGEFLDLMPFMRKTLPNRIAYTLCDKLWEQAAQDCDEAWLELHPGDKETRPLHGRLVRDAIAIPIKDLMSVDPEWAPTRRQLAPVLELLAHLQVRQAAKKASA